jgi:hypothetical protein
LAIGNKQLASGDVDGSKMKLIGVGKKMKGRWYYKKSFKGVF